VLCRAVTRRAPPSAQMLERKQRVSHLPSPSSPPPTAPLLPAPPSHLLTHPSTLSSSCCSPLCPLFSHQFPSLFLARVFVCVRVPAVRTRARAVDCPAMNARRAYAASPAAMYWHACIARGASRGIHCARVRGMLKRTRRASQVHSRDDDQVVAWRYPSHDCATD
jgi:hypothetical protein